MLCFLPTLVAEAHVKMGLQEIKRFSEFNWQRNKQAMAIYAYKNLQIFTFEENNSNLRSKNETVGVNNYPFYFA